ncbi:MAG: ribosome silencing factor, partial [Nitrospinota bacterium]
SKKALDMKCLDVGGLSDIADRFIIFSGTSTTHVQQVAEEIEAKLRHSGEKKYSVEGLSGGLWVLLDFGDMIIHIFHHETRKFYDLDKLWGDAPRFKLA